jgi:hypothetical protein
MRMFYLWCFVWCLCACNPTSSPTPTATPYMALWGQVVKLGEAPTIFAPTVLEHGQTWFGWTTPQENQVRHIASFVGRSPRILALDAWNPFAYQILPADENATHWLWLDRTAESSGFFLQSAIVDNTLIAQVGVNQVSRSPVTQFTAIPVEGGAVRVLWQETLNVGVHQLWTTEIDVLGRFKFATPVREDAELPTFVEDNLGTVWLFWVEGYRIWRGQWLNNQLQDARPLLTMPYIASGERLDAWHVALDNTRIYVFWQMIDMNQRPYTLFAHGTQNPQTWSTPQKLSMNLQSATVQTGFNSGTVFVATESTDFVGWATPLSGQHNSIAVVATLNDDLVMVYLQNGEILGGQILTQVGQLFSAPNIVTDGLNNLTLTWARPSFADRAELFILTSKF